MKTALLATAIPLGYILCGLLMAKAIMAYYVKPDGTYDRTDDAPTMAAIGGVFWPFVLPIYIGNRIYHLVKRSHHIADFMRPKAERERIKREAAAQVAQLNREREYHARRAAEKEGLPWPTTSTIETPDQFPGRRTYK